MKWDEMSPRERDALVAVEVMGWRMGTMDDGRLFMYWIDPEDPKAFYGAGYTHSNQDYDFKDFAPSTDIAAAWEVVEKIKGGTEDWWVALLVAETVSNPDGPPNWARVMKDTDVVAEGRAESAPEAICLAALRAVGVDV